MDEVLKALLLLNSVGASNASLWKKFILTRPPSALWTETHGCVKELGLSEAAHAKIISNYKSAWAEYEYENCVKKGIRIIACADKCYPEVLNDLSDPPLLLYWHGSAQGLPGENISVIGTRRATSYGKKIAGAIGRQCAELGIGLISGGASGIDGAAHAGACENGGQTFAVFGTGIDRFYPSSNRMLFDKIREKGALITEYPLGTSGEPWRFPRRNRIVAALSAKIVVVEAPEKSGAMITARQALELGRDIWAVPGHIDEETAGGGNRLIYDGAHPLIDIEIFFGAGLGQLSLFGDFSAPAKPAVPKAILSENEQLVVDELKRNGEKTVDNISLGVTMSAAEVMKIINVLSAKGLVYSSGPGRFSSKI